MLNKLKEYGFDDWQIERLLKVKKLNCSHGVYTIKGNKLYLNGIEKVL